MTRNANGRTAPAVKYAAAFILLLVQPASAAPMRGVAARYREGLMERAAEIHGVRVPPGRELCASPTQRLGTLLTVTSRVTGKVWRCVVVDVAQERHRASIIRRGIVVELTPRGAMVICGSVKRRPSDCPVLVEVGR